MYNGKCPNCGAEYRGWALGNPGIKYCSKCSKPIDVSLEEEQDLPFRSKKQDKS